MFKTRIAAAAVALLLAGTAHAGLVSSPTSDLVNNGGFEAALSGWTRFGDLTYTGTTGNGTPHSGNLGAYFGNSQAGGIYQTLNTVAGETYSVSYWLRTSPNTQAGNYFFFNWDNSDGAQASIVDGSPTVYQQFNFTLVASSATTDLRFTFRNPSGYFFLDDVSVTAATPAAPVPTDVPEPASWALVSLALLGAGAASRRKRA